MHLLLLQGKFFKFTIFLYSIKVLYYFFSFPPCRKGSFDVFFKNKSIRDTTDYLLQATSTACLQGKVTFLI